MTLLAESFALAHALTAEVSHPLDESIEKCIASDALEILALANMHSIAINVFFIIYPLLYIINTQILFHYLARKIIIRNITQSHPLFPVVFMVLSEIPKELS